MFLVLLPCFFLEEEVLSQQCKCKLEEYGEQLFDLRTGWQDHSLLPKQPDSLREKKKEVLKKKIKKKLLQQTKP